MNPTSYGNLSSKPLYPILTETSSLRHRVAEDARECGVIVGRSHDHEMVDPGLRFAGGGVLHPSGRKDGVVPGRPYDSRTDGYRRRRRNRRPGRRDLSLEPTSDVQG